jgi:peptide deformylase
MNPLKLVTIPDQRLRTPCEALEEFNQQLHDLLEDMYDCMTKNNGIGLAAPQVGILKRVAIIELDLEQIETPNITKYKGATPDSHIYQNRLELINPRIIASNKKVSSEEGCLSIPNYRDSIQRFNSIEVEAHDRNGAEFGFSATGLLAFAVQHEVDHLNGILFTDHLSRLKKPFFKRWLKKSFDVEVV